MMGIYLSGTGNTKHCVEKLVNLLDAAAECIPLEAPHVTETLEMQSTIILGYPTQFSNAPFMVRDFIRKNRCLWNGKSVFCLNTMGLFSGDGTGCAARLLKKYGAQILGGVQIWRCTSRLDYGKRYCLHSPTLDEGPLQQAILSAVNSAMSDHGTLTAQLIDAMEQELAPIPGESMSLGDIDRAMEGLGQQFNDLLRKAADANNTDNYTAQFQSISTAMAEFKRRKAMILQIRQEQEQTNRRVQAVASVLKTASSELTEWDDNVVYQLLEKVTVLSRERIRVTLRDGLEIEQAVEQPKRRKFT